MNAPTPVDEQAREQQAIALFRQFLRDNRYLLRYVAHWGDGYGGYLLGVLQEELDVRPPVYEPARGKAKIPRVLAKRVFERDAYRCVECGGHHDLTCDHIVAEANGGETTFENLQTMCRPCNSRKGAS